MLHMPESRRHYISEVTKGEGQVSPSLTVIQLGQGIVQEAECLGL